MSSLANCIAKQIDGRGLLKLPFPRSRIKFMKDFYVSMESFKTSNPEPFMDEVTGFIRSLAYFVNVVRTLPETKLEESLETLLLYSKQSKSSEEVVGDLSEALEIVARSRVEWYAASLRVSASFEAQEEPLMAKPPNYRRKSRRSRGVASHEILSYFLDKSHLSNVARVFLSTPEVCTASNDLFRVYMEHRALEDLTPFELTIPLRKLRAAFPNSIPVKFFFANNNLHNRQYLQALDGYLEVFSLDAGQPLVCLCIAALLSFLSKHTILQPSSSGRHGVFAKSLAFLLKYGELRSGASNKIGKTQEARIHALSLMQEVFYNMGRYYHDTGLFHLAVKMYQKALALVEEEPHLKSTATNITFEAAHNLVLIYKRSDSSNLALDIMLRYLVFE